MQDGTYDGPVRGSNFLAQEVCANAQHPRFHEKHSSPFAALFLSFNRGAMPSAKSEGARILDVAFMMPRFLLVTHLRMTPLRHTFNHQKNSPARRWSQNLVPGSHGSMQTVSTKGHVRSFHFTGHACRANIVAAFRFPIQRSFRLTAAEPGSLPEEFPLTVEELVPLTDVRNGLMPGSKYLPHTNEQADAVSSAVGYSNPHVPKLLLWP